MQLPIFIFDKLSILAYNQNGTYKTSAINREFFEESMSISETLGRLSLYIERDDAENAQLVEKQILKSVSNIDLDISDYFDWLEIDAERNGYSRENADTEGNYSDNCENCIS